jgi:thiol-disulfide isomerase/thioredoxin
MKLLNFVLVLCVISLISCSRTTKVPLETLTSADNDLGILEIYRTAPIISVNLPSVDTTGARFIKFYSFWKHEKGPWVVIMILPKQDGEELYVDHNYNNDLSDDGPPHFFPYGDNEFICDMVNNEDKNQFIRLAYIRKPKEDFYKYSKLNEVCDSAYNLTADLTENVRFGEQCPEFNGKYGSFYWVGRLTTHRGTVDLDGTRYDIGLCDWTYNGLYNDALDRFGDRLYIDLKHRGKLDASDPNSYFAIQDTITIESKNYRLKAVDKYGKWVEFETITGDSTIHVKGSRVAASITELTSLPIDTSWQQISEQTIDGSTVHLRDYRGKYLLLNFWGVWCSGCRNEIPALKKALRNIPPSKLQIVSFLSTTSVELSKKFLQDSSISWPQIHLSEAMEERFKVYAFPTNILILPNGREAIRTMVIGDRFFQKNIR